MDASCKIQRSIHDVRLTYKYVSRILGTYQIAAIITHVAFYAGWPKGWAVFNLAKEVWNEEETEK